MDPDSDTPLVRALIKELRKRVKPLERSGANLREMEVYLCRRGAQVTSKATISGDGYTPIDHDVEDR